MISGAMVVMPTVLAVMAVNGIVHRIDKIILGEEEDGTPAPVAPMPAATANRCSVVSGYIDLPQVPATPSARAAPTSNVCGSLHVIHLLVGTTRIPRGVLTSVELHRI